MAIDRYLMFQYDGTPQTHPIIRYFIGTVAETPFSGLRPGDLLFNTETLKFWIADTATSWNGPRFGFLQCDNIRLVGSGAPPGTITSLLSQGSAQCEIAIPDTNGTSCKIILMGASPLTAGRIPFVSTLGNTVILTDDSDLTFSGDTLTATKIVVGGGASIAQLDHGTYNPTLTNVANLDSSTNYGANYLRVGSSVTVSGFLNVDPTLTATSTQLRISLPIASNIGASSDCCGTACSIAIAGMCAGIHGDITNNAAILQFVATDVTNTSMTYTFTYRII